MQSSGEMPAKPMPQGKGLMTPDYLSLPSGLFSQDRKVECDGATWWYGVARTDDGPKLVGLWIGCMGAGYRLPTDVRPIDPILRLPKVKEWLSYTLGADAACVRIPRTHQDHQRCIEADTPYKN